MFRKLIALLLLFTLCACSAVAEEPTAFPTETVAETTPVTETTAATIAPTEPQFDPYRIIETMTTEELVGQLFLARFPGWEQATDHLQRFHLGGYILFGKDFECETPSGITAAVETYQSAFPIPLLIAVDEEGGSVTRVSSHPQYRGARFPAPRTLYDQGGMELLLETEQEKCSLLRSLGINVNMGPVCDITTEPYAFMYSRSLGQDADITAQFVCQVNTLMESQGVGSVLKHFPGYGNNTDTHTGIAVDNRSLQALEQTDLQPFRAGIHAGCDAILVSHTIVNCLDANTPASLSPAAIAYLRNTMGFTGVVVTDDLSMGAITDLYGCGEAAVMAVKAGCDLLCTGDYAVQYQAVLEAVNSGDISDDRLTESVVRILAWKHALGLLPIC